MAHSNINWWFDISKNAINKKIKIRSQLPFKDPWDWSTIIWIIKINRNEEKQTVN